MMDATASPDEIRQALLKAALAHVPFDGWSKATFDAAIIDAAIIDAGIDVADAQAACPGGALDLAVAFHQAGDAKMRAQMEAADLEAMKIRERVAFAVRSRLEAVPDKEVVRRGMALFALPQNAATGARLIWGTADAIWEALGDPSNDINWYSKRAILSGVYSSTVLFWLGDESPDHAATWAFLDRRIEDVMQFEKLKAQVRGNALLKGLFAGPDWLLSRVRAPGRAARTDLPGRWTGDI